MKKSFVIKFIVSVVFTLLVSVVCSAAPLPSNRTFVSTTGDDTNPCSKTSPCRTFAGAFAKTPVGGEIDVLDSGDFGPVTINQSVSIIASGVVAGIQVTSGDAIDITGGVVILKGLTLDGVGQGASGIRVTAVSQLLIQDCAINNFTVIGLDYNSGFNSSVLVVKNTSFQNNMATGHGGVGGVYLHPQSFGVRALFEGVLIENNSTGFRADDLSFVTIRNSQIVSNNLKGISVTSTSFAATAIIENCVVSHNQGNGITSNGGISTVTISNVTVALNGGSGIRATGSGVLLSYGNNRIFGNSTDGVPTSVLTQQ